MGFIYCATSKVLKDDHYKIGMTVWCDQVNLEMYLRLRYGTAYGCAVELKYCKKVANTRFSENYVHEALHQYCQGGEIFHCPIEIIQQVFDSIPEKANVVKASFVPSAEMLPEFINVFFSPETKTIDMDTVTTWLDCRKDNLKHILVKQFQENTDYTVEKIALTAAGRPKFQIMITRECFKLLCMQSRTKNADTIRKYLLQLPNNAACPV